MREGKETTRREDETAVEVIRVIIDSDLDEADETMNTTMKTEGKKTKKSARKVKKMEVHEQETASTVDLDQLFDSVEQRLLDKAKKVPFPLFSPFPPFS